MSKLCVWLSPLLFLWPSGARAAGPFALADGDRVVFLGSTLIEREQRYGYWETALTSRYPDRKVVFRNLGWSGDTVFGHARAGFGSVADGFKHLKEHVLSLKPTVIILGYGTNESFDGPEGLPRFVEGCKTLLNALAPTKARIVWLSPLRQEKLPAPLPDPAAPNRNLRLYADAIKELARQQDQLFIDLYDLLGPEGTFRPDTLLTDNGIHLTAHGYWHAALALERGLGLKERAWLLDLKADGTVVAAQGTQVKAADARGLSFEVTDAVLPVAPCPDKDTRALPGTARVLRLQGLAPGKHTLMIDGKPVLTAATADWARGLELPGGPERAQAEQLRQAIIAKNRLYFHRWRPQNETYLFGFRKHEQGQNAREIPQFDPLVAQMEDEIVKLSTPRTHTYAIQPGAGR
jgi:lysophospholipase L1-like esterase